MKVSLKKDTLDVSVVIPALREAGNLRRLLPALSDSLSQFTSAYEVLVIDGDSRDGTEEVVREAGDRFRYICEAEPGYGKAVLRGVREARGRYIITMDADLSHPSEFIERLWHARNEADIIIASRYVPGGQADQPRLRLFLSRTLNRFFSVGLSIPVRDLSSGFRLYWKKVFERLDLTFTTFVTLVEILLGALAQGRHVKEIPFHYRPRNEGKSHARVFRFGIDYLRLFYRIWRIRNSVEFPDYDWRAYYSRIWFQRYWQRRRHNIVLGFVPQGPSVCDVGCGSSRILADLPHAVGVDIRHDKLMFMRKTNRFLVQADGLRLPFPNGAFACVICSQVIEHIPDENGRLLDELTRILAPGGTLVIGTPDYGNWQWRAIEWVYRRVAPGAYGDEHVTQYSLDTLAEALRDRGFTIASYAYICRGELIIRAEKPSE